MHDEKEAATSDLTGTEPDTSREAFMAAIVRLADDEAFRRSFLMHYQLWLHPPLVIDRGLDLAINMTPGAITYIDLEESRLHVERLMRDSGGAP